MDVVTTGRHPRRYDAQAAAAAGLLAGVVAGTFTLIVQGALALARHRPAVAGLVGTATTFLGARALDPARRGAAIAIALIAHYGLSLAFGLAFGLVAFAWQRATVAWASVVWGLLVYSFMAFVALPVANPLFARAEVGFAPAALHLAFGLVLGLAFEELRFHTGGRYDQPPRRGATIEILPHERPPEPPRH